jgi:hypothetical protein
MKTNMQIKFLKLFTKSFLQCLHGQRFSQPEQMLPLNRSKAAQDWFLHKKSKKKEGSNSSPQKNSSFNDCLKKKILYKISVEPFSGEFQLNWEEAKKISLHILIRARQS